jgi:hypothetical protein
MSWTQVVAGSPHLRRSPHTRGIITDNTADNADISTGGVLVVSQPSDCDSAGISELETPVRSTRHHSPIDSQASPHPLELDDLAALLGEITLINTKLTEDRTVQMEWQAAYIQCTADMDRSIRTTTTLLSNLMAHLTTLQSNMDLAISNVRSEITSLGNTMEGVKADLAGVKDTATEAHSQYHRPR